MFCAYTRPRYQASVYRTIGPPVFCCCFFALAELCMKLPLVRHCLIFEPHCNKTGLHDF